MTVPRTDGQEGHCGIKREKKEAFIGFSSKEHRIQERGEKVET